MRGWGNDEEEKNSIKPIKRDRGKRRGEMKTLRKEGVGKGDVQ